GLHIKGVHLGGGGESGEINATIYIVDSTTGQVLASKSVVGTAKKRMGSIGYTGSNWGGDVGGFKNDNVGKAVESACSVAVDWMTSQLPKIPWTGSVVSVKEGKVYINRGSREGVSEGQTFTVGTSDITRDPDSGEVLDQEIKEAARIKVDTVKEKLS